MENGTAWSCCVVILLAIASLVVASVNVTEKCGKTKGEIMAMLTYDSFKSFFDIQPLIVMNQGTKHQKIGNLLLMQLLKKLHVNQYPSILNTLKVCMSAKGM